MSTERPLVHLNLAAGFRGGERQTELLIRELARAGWPQRLLARAGEPLAARCRDIPGLSVLGIPRGSLLQAWRGLAGAGLLHVHEGRSVQLGWLNRRWRGTPWLLTRRVERCPSANLFSRLIYRSADRRVVLSEAIGRNLKRLDPVLDYQVIPSARADLPVCEEAAASLRAEAGGRFLVVHAGVLDDASKGQALIIELARRISGSCPDVCFMLLGSGPDEARFRQAASSLGNFRLAGFVENVGDYLAAADLFIYPSRHEGLGSALLDAMQAGLPILASTAGGIPELLRDGHHALLFPPGDIDALEQAFLSLYRDPALRERLAANNREASADYAPARMAERYMGLYRALLASQQGKDGT